MQEVSEIRKAPWYETAIDLVFEDNYRIDVVYFLMSEENVKRQMALPYMTLCSDATSIAPEGVF